MPKLAAGHLVDRTPTITSQEIIEQMIPPPSFLEVSFATYQPNPEHPSQQEALKKTEHFAHEVAQANTPKKLFSFGKKKKKTPGKGIYLDGGFGVGKTHLLSSIYNSVPGKKLFGSFVEYTNLIGALSYPTAVEDLSDYALVCIDEFELDDPGDTMQMSRLLQELSSRGVSIATTSNTLPGQLGEGRFAAKDFLREISQLSDIFTSVRVDGPDYRQRDLPTAPQSLNDEQVTEIAERTPGATIDHFDRLLFFLAKLHPSKYKKLIEDVTLIAILDVFTLENQADALRFVSFVDRVYDAAIPIVNSGVKIDTIFSADMLGGGYRKKYLRAISRLLALRANTSHA